MVSIEFCTLKETDSIHEQDDLGNYRGRDQTVGFKYVTNTNDTYQSHTCTFTMLKQFFGLSLYQVTSLIIPRQYFLIILLA